MAFVPVFEPVSQPPAATARWVDAHCHLQLDDPDGPLDARPAELVSRAESAGVDWMVCVGTDLATSRAALELGARHRNVFAAVGLHPHEASKLAAEWGMLEPLAVSTACVAIGEAGFDLYYEHSPRDEQETAFRWQIRLARRTGKPLVIHSRDAWDDTFRVLDDEGVPERTVFHCFTGGPDEARAALDRDCYLSFSGIVSFKTAEPVREAARLAPVDRLLVETDAPYLAPEPYRGKRNEPALVGVVGAALAAARGAEVGAIADATRANAARVFGVDR
jgi:TatD DNase family protein